MLAKCLRPTSAPALFVVSRLKHRSLLSTTTTFSTVGYPLHPDLAHTIGSTLNVLESPTDPMLSCNPGSDLFQCLPCLPFSFHVDALKQPGKVLLEAHLVL